MPDALPDLSRFELQCLRMLWDRGDASAKEIHESLEDAPSYSTVRTIFQRLEDKGAVERIGKDGRAVVYRARVPKGAMIRKEVAQFLNTLFDGAAAPLVSHLADMRELDLADLRALEKALEESTDDAPAEEPSR
ncbi:MAG: BlaI/MecI/CopY family transcriptional regulator [Acidobacteria bacterium]|nr:BlaI/MecI/CopY family transcriptional regulator [Acidobacteriota bacterium]